MKTGSFFTFTGPGRISISRSPPRSASPGYRTFKPLAPGPWFNSVSQAQYRKLYAAQLSALDPQAVWDKLHALTDGVEPVLLCWEHPDDIAAGRSFCHRHMAAQWLAERLGHQVDEHQPQRLQDRAQAGHNDQGALFPTS